MSFVKLDCGMLTSTLWIDREAREMMITALLMARPQEIAEPMPTIKIRSLEPDDFIVPPGWYGFVPAAGSGIARSACLEIEPALDALERLAAVDQESRTPDHEGRRMVRVDGGFLILNYDKYRRKDHTAPERMRRFRDKQKGVALRVTPVTQRVTDRNVTQADAEASASSLTKPVEENPLVGAIDQLVTETAQRRSSRRVGWDCRDWVREGKEAGLSERLSVELWNEAQKAGWKDGRGKPIACAGKYQAAIAKHRNGNGH